MRRCAPLVAVGGLDHEVAAQHLARGHAALGARAQRAAPVVLGAHRHGGAVVELVAAVHVERRRDLPAEGLPGRGAIGRVAEHGEARFADAVAPFGLRRGLIGVLHTLAFRGPSTQTEVGAALRVDAAAMSKATAELLERGLVERRPHPADRRAHHLVLTDAGRELQAELWRVGSAVQDELFGALDAEEQQALVDLLRRLPPLAEPGAARPVE